MTTTISRRQFKKAIETGITAAPNLTRSEILALRVVGATSLSCSVGSFLSCPARQAGILQGDWHIGEGRAADFARGFDRTFSHEVGRRLQVENTFVHAAKSLAARVTR